MGDVADLQSDPTTLVDGPPQTSVGIVEPVPAKIGRYTVLRRVGAGGMGVVYAAYDEDLDRKVALKLLHRGPHGDSGGRGRLQREAQALARLSHPNVVQVYEVGSVDDAVFLAMELVRGSSLREWLEQKQPSLRERIEVMLEAGAGLAAAHAAGLVHRDFKLDNVLVGEHGGPGKAARVRVVDFGVARIHGFDDATFEPGIRRRSAEGSTTLTVAGTIVGTPSYMAKELWAGEPADAKSDQFAFCVALYEVLYERKPYVGADREALREAIARGEPAAPPASSPVPARLRRLVLRGLAADPSARWPDMHAVLDELGRDDGRRRRAALAIATGALGMIAVGYVVGARTPDDACARAGEQLAGEWVARRAEVADTLDAIDVPWRAQTIAGVTASLDAYATRLQSISIEGCRATARHEQAGALFDRQTLCLAAAGRDLAALVTVLGEADAAVLERATSAVAELPPLDRCEDHEALLARVDPPDDAATVATVDALRDRLAAARASHRAGRSVDARAAVEALLGEAEAAGYAPLVAETLQLLGSTLQSTGAHELAVARFESAWDTALGAGHDEIALDAATSLTYLVGDILSRFAEGRRWGRDAEAMLARTGAGGRRAGWVSNNIGSVLFRAGDVEGARARYTEAVAIAEALDPPEPEALASFVNNLGNCELAKGGYVTARGHYERAIALREQAFGPSHPLLLSPLNNLASVIRVSGDRDAALEVMRRAVALADQPGIDPIRRAHTHMNLSSAFGELGQREQALVEGEASLAIYRAHGDPNHPNVGIAMANIANDLMALGRVQEGCDRDAEALVILDRALGPDHPTVGPVRGGHANCLIQLGRLDEGLREYEVVFAHWNETNTTDPQLGIALRSYGEALAKRGRVHEGIAALERALVVHSAAEAPALERGISALALATALEGRRRDAERVVALTGLARDAFTAAPGDRTADLARVDALRARIVK